MPNRGPATPRALAHFAEAEVIGAAVVAVAAEVSEVAIEFGSFAGLSPPQAITVRAAATVMAARIAKVFIVESPEKD
jgi:hypothetical protein